ncbi:CatA-like O-acetyltransferase [Bacillus toyonensis]
MQFLIVTLFFSIFNVTKSVNKIPNLKYAHINKQLVEWQELVPTFTNFNQETGLFYSLWLEELTDYRSVDREYKRLIKTMQTQQISHQWELFRPTW